MKIMTQKNQKKLAEVANILASGHALQNTTKLLFSSKGTNNT